ncbi:HEAT repeat domain-containing protein [Gemmata sp. G18]|uniref:HEAT repeat domain-containing protein n=1 Tax=Gemmata palustris TaxID=2822762 RepID=A0ABS5BPY5_9BACT|nr:HEAT repeat domain-containing protein [Gemmata palustris]MBP3955795.1 HEAT repeat domain-containing protein [Gemmata palustris]
MFKIDPKTPVKDLLPAPPKVAPVSGPALTDDLKKVVEVEFQAKPEKVSPEAKLAERTAHQIAKINHMNAKKTDAFMSAFLESRPDLAGLPFAMGDDCRVDGERAKYFAQAVSTVRQALGSGQVAATTVRGFGQTGGAGFVVTNFQPAQAPDVLTSVPPLQAVSAPQSFWQQYTTLCDQEDAARGRADKDATEHVTLARMAALAQMLAPEAPEIRLGLVKYLAGVSHIESSKSLARLVLFSPEDDVRAAAIAALKVRREKDYTDVLVKGLRYPFPAVAKRATEAITKLERTDLIPELLAVLDATDPRMPVTKEVAGKKSTVALEMVKVNHHRNCLMCHAPTGSGTPNPNAISAEVAIQGQPLPAPAEGYRQSTPELMIRLDVTYLRQDFSALLPVKEAHPWPEMQRFDFFVRERKLTEDEAETYRTQLAPKEAGVLSPYHKAALTALRDLTGKDAAPTAEAWKKLLGLATKPVVTRG